MSSEEVSEHNKAYPSPVVSLHDQEGNLLPHTPYNLKEAIRELQEELADLE